MVILLSSTQIPVHGFEKQHNNESEIEFVTVRIIFVFKSFYSVFTCYSGHWQTAPLILPYVFCRLEHSDFRFQSV